MPIYEYRALNRSGKNVRGTVDADNIRTAKTKLKKDGIFILTTWNMWKNKKTKRLILKFGLLKILRLIKLDFKDILMPWHGSKDCYFHNFSMKELEKLAEKAGFKIIKRGEVRVRKNHNFYLTCQKI